MRTSNAGIKAIENILALMAVKSNQGRVKEKEKIKRCGGNHRGNS